MGGSKKLTARKCKLTFMRTLSRLTKEELRDLFGRLTPEGVDSVSEIVFNTLYSDPGLPPKQIKKLQAALASREKDLRFIADRSNSIEDRRRRLIKQNGSGLGLLLVS